MQLFMDMLTIGVLGVVATAIVVGLLWLWARWMERKVNS